MSATASAKPPTAKTTTPKTAYHVLIQTTGTPAPDSATTGGSQPTFRLVGQDITANSAEHAIRIYGEKHGEEATLVAVPSRSWKPVKLTVQTKKIVTLTEAA